MRHIEQYSVGKDYRIWAILDEDCDYSFLVDSNLVHPNHRITVVYFLNGTHNHEEKDVTYEELRYYLEHFDVFQVYLITDSFGVTLSGGEIFIGSEEEILTTSVFTRLTEYNLN